MPGRPWKILKSRSEDFALMSVNGNRLQESQIDVEAGDVFFHNHSIQKFGWDNIDVQVKDRKQGTKVILSENSGQVAAGQVLALIGPSGSGKSTLLNVLANRSKLQHSGTISTNGTTAPPSQIRQISSYVEQDNVQIGGLTVEETLDFASRLSSPDTNHTVRKTRTDDILKALGLVEQRDAVVSPLLRAGLSGGQRRRLGLGTALVTGPKILFLDEPTSGLDSAASHQVISFLAKIAKRHRLIIIASIHQPSSSTFDLFDLVTLISKGKTCYHGPRKYISEYFSTIIPHLTFNDSADHLLDLVNTDFEYDEGRQKVVVAIFDRWQEHVTKPNRMVVIQTTEITRSIDDGANIEGRQTLQRRVIHHLKICWILLHRNFIKSYRDPLVYGTRLAINASLSVVIGTVWWRLPYEQSAIQTFVNCLFFSSAFMALMVVAYAPPVIEDIRMLQKEYASGLYGAFAFTVANFLVGIPWLLLVALVFSTVVYWLSALRVSATGFALFTMWLYGDLLAAESLMVLISALTPQFVTALAIVSFANGLWLAVDGFLVPVSQLNAFWKYVFHYANFQTYVFQGMMVNQFKETSYNCEPTINGSYHCMYPSNLSQQGKVNGTAVLEIYDYSQDPEQVWYWVGYLAVIILVHRIVGMIALQWRAGRK